MNAIFDILLVLLYLVVILVCATKGLVKSIWSIVTIIGSVLVTCYFGPILGSWISDEFINDYVCSQAYEIVESISEEKGGEYDASKVSEELPDEWIDMLNYCGADIDEIRSDFAMQVSISRDELYGIAGSIALPISNTISNIIGYIVVFICSVIVISLIGLILKLIVKLPIIKHLDFIFGALLGTVEGFVILWLICLILRIFIERGIISSESNETFFMIIEKSRLFEFFGKLSLSDIVDIRVG